MSEQGRGGEGEAGQREIEALSQFAKVSVVYPVLKRHTGILVRVGYPHRACTCGWDWPKGARVRTDPATAERLGLTLQELRNRDLGSTGLLMVRDWVWRAHLAHAIETEAGPTPPTDTRNADGAGS